MNLYLGKVAEFLNVLIMWKIIDKIILFSPYAIDCPLQLIVPCLSLTNEGLTFFFILVITVLCARVMCGCVDTSASVSVWQLKDNFVESVLSVHRRGVASKNGTQVIGLALQGRDSTDQALPFLLDSRPSILRKKPGLVTPRIPVLRRAVITPWLLT